MLNVKQGSYEYLVLKYESLTRWGRVSNSGLTTARRILTHQRTGLVLFIQFEIILTIIYNLSFAYEL